MYVDVERCCRLENISLRLDDINMKENAIRLSLQTMDSCLMKLDQHSARHARTLAQLSQAAGVQGSPPSQDSSGLVESGGQKGRERENREYTPPQRLYNEDKLRPFTDYRGGSRQRPPLQHGMSVDRSEFEQRFGGMTTAGRIRRSSLSQSEEAVQPHKKVPSKAASDAPVNPGNPEPQHPVHNQPDIPDGAVLPRFSRSVSVGRSGSRGVLSLRPWVPTMPLTPIVTPTRMEYTSITDTIDTSCIERPVNYSPPDTPELKPWSRRGSGLTHRKKAGHHHQHKHRHRHKTAASLNEGLRTAEEIEHKQMEVRHLFMPLASLTPGTGTGFMFRVRLFVHY